MWFSDLDKANCPKANESGCFEQEIQIMSDQTVKKKEIKKVIKYKDRY